MKKEKISNSEIREAFRKNQIVVVTYYPDTQQVYLFLNYTKLEVVTWFSVSKIGEAVSSIDFVEPHELETGVYTLHLPFLVNKDNEE